MLPLRLLSACALALLAGASIAGARPPENAELAALAHLLAFGRPALALPADSSAESATLATQLENHRAALRQDSALRERTARAAWLDAFGRAPSAAELRVEAPPSLLYTERMQRHLADLRAAPDEYREVIRRAYALVVHRQPYPEEFDYWHPHGTLSFVALVACLEDWARRNQPGLMATAGIPTVPARSRFVTIVALPPEIASAARAALFPAAVDARVLAAGAAGLRTPGGMHLALVGRE